MVRFLLVGVVIVLGASWAFGGEVLGDFKSRDLWQTVQARKALADDPQLAPLNLGVYVRGGVAFLWGPAPTTEAAFRAETRLRALFELIDVRNDLEIMPEYFTPALVPLRPRMLPNRPPPALPEPARQPLALVS